MPDREMFKRILISTALVGAAVLFTYLLVNKLKPSGLDKTSPSEMKNEKSEKIDKFNSEQEFKDYLVKSQNSLMGFPMMLRGAAELAPQEMTLDNSAKFSAPLSASGIGGGSAQRVSETNVQVAGIDEPDIVKTDGQEIYLSQEFSWMDPRILSDAPVMKEMPSSGIGAFPQPIQSKTRIIKSFPPTELEKRKIANIEKAGTLLVSGNILIIFSGQSVYGYDIADTKTPQEKWKADIKDNQQINSARLYKDKLYLITSNQINSYKPCPIEPLVSGGETVSIACDQIYHPISLIQSSTTFNVMILNPQSGKVEDKTSFVGTSGQSIVYMSGPSVYVTYSYPGDLVEFMYNFLKEQRSLFPKEITEKIAKLREYDISTSSKLSEMFLIIQQYENSLGNDEKLKLENEVQNKMTDYAKMHNRELEKTGIIKINSEDLNISASGIVPGNPLNQFSLDEYQGNLRVATSIGGGFWGMGFGGRTSESVNDVYILNKNLDKIGKVEDLGKGEKIYSARFIEDKAYVVTFKQIDPFYVIDLSDPKNPQMKGELKIPGYSSYLHPINKDKIIGIGKENNRVKISLFNVSSPSEPREVSKYTLDEYWTEVENNHHAFLLDDKHNVFFLPGGKGGYVFSYTGDELKLVKAISDNQAKRALYLNDYLYVIGQNKVVALDEFSWEEVGKLEF